MMSFTGRKKARPSDAPFDETLSSAEAFAAVDGTVVAGLKGNLAGLAAFGADSVEHLAGSSCVAGLLACIPAITAALRLVLKALFSIELLFPGSEHEFFPTVLANECFSLIPEMAALCALDGNIEFSDELQFGFPDGKTVKVYASQLSDYAMLDYCFTNIISNGDFGEETRGIWQDLVRSSVLYRALARAQANGVNEMPNLSKLVLNVDENFVLR